MCVCVAPRCGRTGRCLESHCQTNFMLNVFRTFQSNGAAFAGDDGDDDTMDDDDEVAYLLACDCAADTQHTDLSISLSSAVASSMPC